MKVKVFLASSVAIASLFLCGKTIAQQMPNIGSHNIAQLFYNPAYAGSGEELRAVAITRTQWRGFDGAPSSSLVSIEAPLGKKIGAGLVLSNDVIGSLANNTVSINGSYRIYLSSSSYIQAGMNANLSFVSVGNEDAFQWDDNDPVKFNSNSFIPKIGFGAYYFNPNYYLGLSATDIFAVDTKDLYYDDYLKKSNLRKNYFFTAGSKFDISEYVTLTPSVLVKYYRTTPIGVTINMGMILNQTLTAGVTYSSPSVFGVYGMVSLTPKTRFGYRHEFKSSKLSTGELGTGEFILTYGFGN